MKGVEDNQQLAEMIKVFAQCMEAARGSEEERQLARKFNLMLDDHLSKHPDDSIATIAFNLNKLGVPYEEAMRDVMYVRHLGIGTVSTTSPQKGGTSHVKK
jgi:hypothetical protein